jgi:Uma2 family endonuclease
MNASMVLQSKPRVTPAEYLAADRAAAHKSEYLGGEVFAMGGASERHNLIVVNVVAELRRQLKGRPCRVYPSDMRVRIKETGLYAYPDVTVVCGPADFDDEQRDTLLNPTLIIEVLSKSKESYDRGEKCAHYRKLLSLAEYVLIVQDKVLVEHYARQPEQQWLLSEASNLQQCLQLPAIQSTLDLADVYDKVDLADR